MVLVCILFRGFSKYLYQSADTQASGDSNVLSVQMDTILLIVLHDFVWMFLDD